MRKFIFLFLISLISGIGIFINFENLNPLVLLGFILVISIILLFIDKKYLLISLGIGMGFSLSLLNFNSYKLKDFKNIKADVTILQKRETKDSYRYFVRVKGKKIKEKSVFFSDYEFEIGDKLIVGADVNIPNRNTNPNLFNYRNYLISKNVASNLDIKEFKKIGETSNFLLKLRRKFYSYIHDIYEKNLSKKSSSFVISVILGENLLENNDIRDLGLSHILAVSGLHIDLLFAAIIFIFNIFNLDYKKAYIFALSICLFYGYLIAFPFSVIRVLLVNLIGFLGFLYKKPFDKIKALLIAATLILLVNPFAILNSGFILSFVATSGVYLIYPKFKKYFKDKLIMKNLGFTATIQATLFPFSIYYFGKINLLSILANFLIVPIFTLAMYLIFAITLLYPLVKLFIKPFFAILNHLILSITNISHLLNKIKFLTIDFAHPSILICIYFYLLVLMLIYIKKSNRALFKKFLIINLLFVSISPIKDLLKPEVSFTMIDIGQGDAFLLNDGGDYYLFDVGGPKYDDYDSGQRILIPYLKSLGIKKIKGVFISHEDSDHSGNLETLYDNFKVECLITGPLNKKLIKKYKAKVIKENQKIKLKSGKIKCVFQGIEGEENSHSTGFLINIKRRKILTLGDLPKEYEDKLDLRSDILKVSHHGSRSSTSKNFLSKVDPKVALISAGRNNKYGHPHKEVIENLSGVKIYNSQKDGLVKISFDKKVKIDPYLKGGYFRWKLY